MRDAMTGSDTRLTDSPITGDQPAAPKGQAVRQRGAVKANLNTLWRITLPAIINPASANLPGMQEDPAKDNEAEAEFRRDLTHFLKRDAGRVKSRKAL